MDLRINPCSTGCLILLILWINQSFAVPNKDTFTNAFTTTNTQANSDAGSTISKTKSPQKYNIVNKGEETTFSPYRLKRNVANPYKASVGVPDLQHLFPSNVDNEALQKWLALLTSKPKNTMVDEYDDDFEDDDAPAIDLVHGKKPGTMRSSTMLYSKDAQAGGGGAWVDEPIVLHQHRMNKKSATTVIPELFFREAVTSSRTQPDPFVMRKFLARISRRFPQSDDAARNGRWFSVGQLLEHSSKINDGIPVIHRLVL